HACPIGRGAIVYHADDAPARDEARGPGALSLVVEVEAPCAERRIVGDHQLGVGNARAGREQGKRGGFGQYEVGFERVTDELMEEQRAGAAADDDGDPAFEGGGAFSPVSNGGHERVRHLVDGCPVGAAYTGTDAGERGSSGRRAAERDRGLLPTPRAQRARARRDPAQRVLPDEPDIDLRGPGKLATDPSVDFVRDVDPLLEL